MLLNKSQELVRSQGIVTGTDRPDATQTAPLENLVDLADQAARNGNLQESREHLTRIFELLAVSPHARVSIQTDPHYQPMRRSA